jgi:gamma-glutamyl:cysteine ligase YbdK (ATP-grasp superfamily)
MGVVVSQAGQLSLFQAFGIELEHMLVDAKTLNVRPVADELMKMVAGTPESEVERSNGVSWSNELVNHVVELKSTEPTSDLETLGEHLQASVRELNAILKGMGEGAGGPAMLMPGAMHPWMDPKRETRLWAHEYGEVYAKFDALFDCKRHGWANLQSVHLNLPFDGDEEFGRLHAAVRLVLPLLPAICASSPILEGVVNGTMCNRLNVYASNQAKTPSLTGRVIPEGVFTREQYQKSILDPIARDVIALDPSGTMQPAWMNSRGAIARFDRGSIEIRVMDVQECPAADIAICAGVIGVLQWLVEQGPSDTTAQMGMDTDRLRAVLDRTIRDADQALVDDEEYLELLAIDEARPAWEIWSEMLELAEVDIEPSWMQPLQVILDEGPLARRVCAGMEIELSDVPANGVRVERERMERVYRSLCACLNDGKQYRA